MISIEWKATQGRQNDIHAAMSSMIISFLITLLKKERFRRWYEENLYFKLIKCVNFVASIRPPPPFLDHFSHPQSDDESRKRIYHFFLTFLFSFQTNARQIDADEIHADTVENACHPIKVPFVCAHWDTVAICVKCDSICR